MLTLIAIGLQCTDARIASRNLATAAEQFELTRRIVFYNGITGDYILVILGRCSIEVQGQGPQKQLEVTCKTGASSYKKHHLGLSDNVSYFSEQLDSVNLSIYRYRVIFKPTVIVPDVNVRTP
jgi:hypothetical protein